MSALEFISALVGQLISWPVVVLVVFVLLREPIRELVPKIRSYEGLGQKLTFGDRLAVTEKSVSDAVGAIQQQASAGGATDEQDSQRSKGSEGLGREAELNPSFVVLSSWEQLNSAIADLVGDALGPNELRLAPYSQLRELQKRHIVNSDFVRAVSELRELRNRVAHGQHNPSAGEAIAYVESAEELARAAQVLANITRGQRAMNKGGPA